MTTRSLWLILPLLFALPLSAATVTGRVFLDADGDGAWQEGEEALAGALVSDGAQIVTSGADGIYSLDTDGPTVFVVNPTGTWPSRGFWRPVGDRTTGSDFPMSRQEQPLPFYFVQGTDHHIRPEIADKMTMYVEAINSLPLPLAFVVHTGDMVVDVNLATVPDSRALFEAYQEMVAGLKMPLFHLPGNHEHVAVLREDVPSDTPGWGKGLYAEHFGPLHYAFTYAGVQFIAMDGTDLVDGKLQYAIPEGCMAFLETYLQHVEPGTPIVMLIHEPFVTLAQRGRVEELLEDYKVLLALSGHGHGIASWDFAGGKEIMGGATSYAWHGAGFGPNAMGYHLLKITGDGFENAFGDWAEKYPVTVDAPARSDTLTGKVQVRARFLDPAGEVTAVDARIFDSAATVDQFGTDGLYRTLTCELDASQAPDGFEFLQLVLSGEGEPMVEKQPFLVLTGRQDEFAARGPAELRLRLHEVAAANAVLVNGVEVAKTAPDAGEGDWLKVEIAAEQLRRLNAVEVVAAKPADGEKHDDFWLDGVDMVYEGKVHADQRGYKWWPYKVVCTGDEPGRRTFYIDLTLPEG